MLKLVLGLERGGQSLVSDGRDATWRRDALCYINKAANANVMLVNIIMMMQLYISVGGQAK